MVLNLDLTPVLAVFLLSLRIGVLLVMTPIFSNLTKLVSIRVLMTLVLSVAMVWGQSLGGQPLWQHLSLDLGSVLMGAIGEVVLGSVLAFSVFAAFGVFSLAGKIVDIQSGFGLASVFDPVTRASAPIFSHMLNLLAVTVFFSLDGHHALMRGIAFSVQQLPPGTLLKSLPMAAVLRQFGLMFSLAVALIAPVMFGLFLVESGMALLSRVLPQMNVLVLGVAVKIVVALIIFALSLGLFLPLMGRVFATIFTFWEQVLT